MLEWQTVRKRSLNLTERVHIELGTGSDLLWETKVEK